MHTGPRKQELQQALWSVQYYTQFRTRAGVRSALVNGVWKETAPIPLKDALAILEQDADEHDLVRRQRAFVKLGSAGLFNKERLRRFCGNEKLASTILGRMRRLGEQLGLRNVAEIMSLDASKVAAAVNEEMKFLVQNAVVTCHPVDAFCVACLDAQQWRTTATAGARVQRPIEHLGPVLDPRNWPTCGEIFDATDIVEWHASTSAWGPPTTPVALPAPGLPWTTRTLPAGPRLGLLEQVTIGATASGFVASFTNVLGIDVTRSLGNLDSTKDEIRVEYRLIESLPSTIFGHTVDGVLRVDEGYGLARRDPLAPQHWSIVEMRKTIKFDDLTSAGASIVTTGGFDLGEVLNYMASGMLCLWLEDPSQMSPCCNP